MGPGVAPRKSVGLTSRRCRRLHRYLGAGYQAIAQRRVMAAYLLSETGWLIAPWVFCFPRPGFSCAGLSGVVPREWLAKALSSPCSLHEEQGGRQGFFVKLTQTQFKT